jgi:hypothetical protein
MITALLSLIALIAPVTQVSYACRQGKFVFVGSGPTNEILITDRLVIDLKSGYGAVQFERRKCNLR